MPKETGPSKPLLSISGSVHHLVPRSVRAGGVVHPRVRRPRDTSCVNLGNGLGGIWAGNLGILGTSIMVWEGKVLVLRP